MTVILLNRYPVFYPPKAPQAPISVTVQPRLISPNFGAGDPEFSPDGINVTLRQVQLSFAVLTQAEFNEIDQFLNANKFLNFLYTLPDEAAPRLWKLASRTPSVKETVWGYDVMLQEVPQI